MRVDPDWKARAVGTEDAVARIKSGMEVFVQGAAATPTPLLNALCRRQDLADVRLYHLHVSGDIPFADSSHKGRFFSTSLSRSGVAGARRSSHLHCPSRLPLGAEKGPCRPQALRHELKRLSGAAVTRQNSERLDGAK
jgi:hypothetical protein